MADATRTVSTRLRLEGESEYNAQLKNIGSSLKVLSSELAVVSAKFEGQLNGYEALSEKGRILAASLDEQEKKHKVLSSALGDAVAARERLSAALEDERQSYEKIQGTAADSQQAQDNHKKRVNELEESIAKASNTVSYYGKEVNFAEAAVIKASKALEENNAYLAEAEQAADGTASSIDGAGKAVKQAASDIGEFGKEARQAGEDSEEMGSKGSEGVEAIASALAAAGIAKGVKEIADMLRECVDAAIEFESAMAGVRRTVGGSESEIGAFASQIREMSTTIPMTTGELAKIAETAGQLGIASSDVMGFTEVMAKLGTATDITAEQAAAMLAQFANVTGLDPADYGRMGAVIAELGDSTATTAAKVVEMSQRMAGAASVAGFSQTDIMGLSAAVGSLGIESQAGGTAMATLISKLQTAVETGEGLTEFAEAAGMGAAEFSRLWGSNAVGALDAFIKGLGDTERTGKSAIVMLGELGINNVRQRQAIIGLSEAGDLLSRTIAQGSRAWEENTALGDKAAIMYETMESKQTLLANSVDNLKIAIGEQLMPALSGVVDAGAGIAQWAADFIEQNEWLVPVIAALSAGLAVLAVGVGGLTLAVNFAIPAIQSMNAALAANPVFAVVAAVTALIAVLGTLAATMPNSELKEFRDGLDAIGKAREESDAKTLASASVAETYINRLKALEAQGLDTADAQREYSTVVDLLNRTIPGLNATIDEQTGLIDGGTEALLANTEAWKENALAQAMQNMALEYVEALAEAQVEAALRQRELTAATIEYEATYERLEELTAQQAALSEEEALANQALQDSIEELATDLNLLAMELGNAENAYERSTRKVEEAQEKVNEYSDAITDAMNASSSGTASVEALNGAVASQETALSRASVTLEDLTKSYKALSSEIGMLVSAFDEQHSSGELSLDTVAKLIEAGYASALAIDEETGAVYLNAEAYYELISAKLMEQRAAAEAAMRGPQIAAMAAEQSAAEALARGNIELALSYLQVAAAAKAEADGIEASLAAMEGAMQRLRDASGQSLGGGSRGGGGGGGGSGGSSADSRAVSEALAAERRATEEMERSIAAALEAVKTGYLSLEEAAETFGVSLEEITERHSIATLYDEQMELAVAAVTSGSATVFEAMRQFGVEYSDLASAIEAAGGGMKRQYDAHREELDYHYRMGQISTSEYYDALTSLRDEYLEENSASWRMANVELYNMQRDMNAAMVRDQEEAYRQMLEAAKAYAAAQKAELSGILASQKELITSELNRKKDALNEQLKARKEAIAAELDAEKARLGAIIDGINAEMRARRELRADDDAEAKIKQAEEKVGDAQRSLAAAQAQMEYARDNAAKAEAEKLVLQKEKALSDAQDALKKAHQDYEDQLWFREKQTELDAAKSEILTAEAKAKNAREEAEAEVKSQISDADSQAKRHNELLQQEIQGHMARVEADANASAVRVAQERSELEARAMLNAYIRTVNEAAEQAANVAASAAAGAVTNAITKNAEVNVTYTNAAATSGQIASAVQKALDRM